MLYTLFEWAKENQEALMENHKPVVTAVVSTFFCSILKISFRSSQFKELSVVGAADTDTQQWGDDFQHNSQEEGEEGAADQSSEEEDHQQNRYVSNTCLHLVVLEDFWRNNVLA